MVALYPCRQGLIATQKADKMVRIHQKKRTKTISQNTINQPVRNSFRQCGTPRCGIPRYATLFMGLIVVVYLWVL